MDATVERQDQADCVLGNRVGRVRRNTGDGHPERAGGLQIDVVETGAAERNELSSAVRELLQDAPVEVVVYERAHRGIPGASGTVPRSSVGLK